MLGQAGRPLFSLAGIPIAISPWHYFFLLVLFRRELGASPALGLAVIMLASLSVLAHELGHAVVSKVYGLDPRIELVLFGGLTHHRPPRRPLHHFLIAAAGPVVNLALGGALLVLAADAEGELGNALALVTAVNLFWGLLNLVPVFPLDGGQMLGVVLGRVLRPWRAERVLHQVAIVAGALVAIFGFMRGSFFLGMLFGLMAFENWRALSAMPEDPERHLSERHEPVRIVIDAARAAYEAGRFEEALRLLHQARAMPLASREENAQIWQILALAAARLGQTEEALRYAERAPASSEMAQVQAACLLAIGDAMRARAFLGSPAATLLDPRQTARLAALAGNWQAGEAN
jgi:Zn-dependent protease